MRALTLALVLAGCGADHRQTAPPEPPAPAPGAGAASNESNLAQMPGWEAARAAGVEFRAVGQEPGWLLDIYRRERIRLLWDYGEQIADFPLTEPSYPVEGVRRHQAQANGRTLTVSITRQPCNDAMSGQGYPASVEVVIDGRTLNGCGRGT